MRGQQITPWSIYNKTIVNDRQEGEKEEKEVIRFPKIEKKSGRMGLREEWSIEKGRHSARQVVDVMKHDKQPFSPYLSEFIAKNEEIEKRKQLDMQGKQADIEKSMNDRIMLQMIKAELRREHSQLDFMNLLKEQHAEQVEPEQILSINTAKRSRSFLLDRHPFPRVNVDKNVMLINLNHDESPSLEEKPARDTQAIKAILKKEINSMISNRMKIMGKAKQLAYKP